MALLHYRLTASPLSATEWWSRPHTLAPLQTPPLSVSTPSHRASCRLAIREVPLFGEFWSLASREEQAARTPLPSCECLDINLLTP